MQYQRWVCIPILCSLFLYCQVTSWRSQGWESKQCQKTLKALQLLAFFAVVQSIRERLIDSSVSMSLRVWALCLRLRNLLFQEHTTSTPCAIMRQTPPAIYHYRLLRSTKKMIIFKNIFHSHCPHVRPTASSYYCLLLWMPRMSQSSNHEGKAKKKEAVSRK